MIKRSIMLLVVGLLLNVPLARAACMIDIIAVNFGYYDVFESNDLETTGTINLSCEPKSAFMITLSTGNSNDYVARNLSYGTHQLIYNLYANAGMTKILGDGSASTVVLDGNNVKNRTLTVYGRIPAQQNVRVGTYTDNIMVNLYF